MRVIAGIHKSKALESLEGRNTRPTMDKVKEGIFNSCLLYTSDAADE